MANVHLKEAARNLRRAVDDVQQQLVQTKADNDQQIQQLQKRIQDINNEKRNLLASAALTDSDQIRAAQQSSRQNLEREIGEINKDIYNRNDVIRKTEAELERQKAEFNRIASMLDNMG